jgi:tRNA pseudouridine38-40 synthase
LLLQRLRLTLEYDGTAYHGFQRQAGRMTIQGALEAALARVTRQPIQVVVAGRTDAGVHALGQVVHLDWEPGLDLPELLRAVNAVLPRDIVIRRGEGVSEAFHARYSAVSRAYRYRILNTAVRSPMARRFAAHEVRPLEVAAMQAGGDLLVGCHDFASFGGKMWSGGTTRRTMFQLQVRREREQVTLDFRANAYLSRMVRAITGTLMSVGRGETSVEEVKSILEAGDRSRAKWLAPPEGLCLMEVEYPDSQLFVRSKG